MKTILVVAAHPDDEVLGCGGTMARHAAQGDKVHSVFIADGEGARCAFQSSSGERYTMAENAAKILGTGKPRFLDFPDNRLDSVALLDIVQPLEEAIAEIKPSVVYTHHGGDLNVDHRVTQQAVLTACRPIPGSNIEAIYGFEVLSSTEWAEPTVNPFCPSFYVDISEQFPKKIGALKAYDEEMRDFPHSRSYKVVEALAKVRGGNVGLLKAEAFTSVRHIWRKA